LTRLDAGVYCLVPAARIHRIPTASGSTPMALKRISRNLSVLRELAAFLRERRLWWLLPMVAVFVLIAVLLVLAQSSAVAPLLYPLF